MLIKHDLPVNKEETERCDTLRYSWEKLQTQTSEVQTELLQVQPQFKSELIENVLTFKTDCDDFYSQYDNVSLHVVFIDIKISNSWAIKVILLDVY